jgi:hypothetical protein
MIGFLMRCKAANVSENPCKVKKNAKVERPGYPNTLYKTLHIEKRNFAMLTGLIDAQKIFCN